MDAQEPKGPIWWEEYLPRAVEAARVALWAWQVDTDKFAMDERAFELWGLPVADQITYAHRWASQTPYFYGVVDSPTIGDDIVGLMAMASALPPRWDLFDAVEQVQRV